MSISTKTNISFKARERGESNKLGTTLGGIYYPNRDKETVFNKLNCLKLSKIEWR